MLAEYKNRIPKFKDKKDLDSYYDYVETFEPSQISRAYETERILNKPRDERSSVDWIKDAARRRGENMEQMSPARQEYLRQWAQYNARQNALNNARSPEEYTQLMKVYYGEPPQITYNKKEPQIDVEGLYNSLQKGLAYMNQPNSIFDRIKGYFGGD